MLVTLALVASACGSRVRQEDWDALAAQQGGTTATTTSERSDGGTDDGVTDSATDQPQSTRTRTSTQSSASKTQDTLTGALPAPADGTYTYDQTSDGDTRTSSEKWTAQREAQSVTLTAVQKEEEEGDVVTTTTKFRVTRAAFEMLSETSVYNDEDPDTCTYKPPAVVLELPLKVGSKWKTGGACGEDGGDVDNADADSLQVEVTGTATDTIGGKQVKTFLVRATQSFDSTDDTTGERSTFGLTDVRHVDPNTLLVVVEDITFEFDGEKSTAHRQLRSLTPA
jgi:hypothetical protein